MMRRFLLALLLLGLAVPARAGSGLMPGMRGLGGSNTAALVWHIKTFTASGSWLRPSDAVAIWTYEVGAGGGCDTTSALGAGGGGISLDQFPDSGRGVFTVTIGAGNANGAGGATTISDGVTTTTAAGGNPCPTNHAAYEYGGQGGWGSLSRGGDGGGIMVTTGSVNTYQRGAGPAHGAGFDVAGLGGAFCYSAAYLAAGGGGSRGNGGDGNVSTCGGSLPAANSGGGCGGGNASCAGGSGYAAILWATPR